MLRSLFVLVACTAPLFAQSADIGAGLDLKLRFEKFVADKETAGAVLAVGNAEGQICRIPVGKADIAGKKPMEHDGLFRIASMTKPITAIAIMMLQDEGKLSVDDPVEKHLPDFKGQMVIASTDKDAGTVTLKKPKRPIQLRDLLTHTSGLNDYPAGMADIYAKRNRTLNETTIAVSQRPLFFEPGTKWSYCNSGIDTLGRIVEVVSGESFEKFLQTRLFDKLKMEDTTFDPDEKQSARLAKLYGKDNGELKEAPNGLIGLPRAPKHPIPAGGLVSNAADLGTLYRMMLNKGELGGTRILSEKAVAEMTKTQTDDIKTGFVDGMSFGYGWAVVKEPKGVTAMLSKGTYGHGGAFGTQGWIDPEKGLYFIMLIQRTGLANGDASEMRKEFQRLAVEAYGKK